MKMSRFLIFGLYVCFLSNAAYPETQTIESACFQGQPASELFEKIVVIEEDGYVVGFSPETKTPIWACYRLTHVEDPPDLTRPKIKFKTYSDGEVTVTHEDYSNSGFDRGHMAPSSGIGKCYGKQAQIGTFKTTNICPQHPGLNQRCWERFEKQVADFYADRFAEIWIVSGPIFQDPCVVLESDIRVPEAFYKIAVAKIKGNIEMLGIIMPNERTENTRISSFVHSVDEIEDLAGIDFFRDLDDTVEDMAESKETPHQLWNVNWELRPTFSGRSRPIHTKECD